MHSLIYPAVIGFLLEALLHFIPWNRLLGRELTPPWTYIGGLAPLIILTSIWLWTARPSTNLASIGGLWAIVGAGGLGCLIGYVLDSQAALRLLKKFGGRHETDCSS